MKKYLVFDLGASSGRAMLGILDDKLLKLHEIHRFSNKGIRVFDSLYWDVLHLFEEMKIGLKKAAEKYGSRFDGISTDSWGVDFVLLDENANSVGFVHHYRDNRTNGMLDKMLKVVSKKEIFERTGIQFMQLNTSCQLYSIVKAKAPQLAITKSFLMIADYFNFLLSGQKCQERSLASTTQLYEPVKKEWARDIIEKLKLKFEWFPRLVDSGTIIGPLFPTVAAETGVDGVSPVIASLSHDTACAVAAVPVEQNIKTWAFISSGTWSLMGLELKQPIINDAVLDCNLTNESGAFGTTRFLKNIMGLWLIQECKNLWERRNGKKISFDDISKWAEKAEPFKTHVDPDDIAFLNPPNMIEALLDHVEARNQKPPTEMGEVARMIFEGLAFRYREVLEQLQKFSPDRIEKIYIVGGGSKNELLCQFTANATGLPVDAGPAEATAIGNILMQAIATKQLKSFKEMRKIVRNSFEIKTYLPKNVSEWDEMYETHLKIVKGKLH
ncbi:MAG: rhamnulokinase [Candidatus Helarchaeota archaeon]